MALNEIDFSLIPAPDVIEQIDYEVILQALIDDLLLRDPTLTAVNLESEPIAKLLQVYAFRESLIRAKVNDSAHAVMLPYSTGNDLANLGAFYGVSRLLITPEDITTTPITPAVFESDAAFRERIRLGLNARTTAGARTTYEFFALSSNADILDISVVSPTAGRIHITVLSRTGTGVPEPEVITDVIAAVNDNEVRPLTDHVFVAGASIVDYIVQAVLVVYPGPDPVQVQADALASLNEWAVARHKLGNDITLSGLYAALHVTGVQNVVLTAPVTDVIIDDHEVSNLTLIDLSVGSTDV